MGESDLRLVVRAGPKIGHDYALYDDEMIVGRSPVCDIVIDDPEVSRQHARLRRTAQGVELQDLGSTNGTFLDGERLGGSAELLKPGNIIALGSQVMLMVDKTGGGAVLDDMLANPPADPVEQLTTLADDSRLNVADQDSRKSIAQDPPSVAQGEANTWDSSKPIPVYRPADPPADETATPAPSVEATNRREVTSDVQDGSERERRKQDQSRNIILAVLIAALAMACTCTGLIVIGLYVLGL